MSRRGGTRAIIREASATFVDCGSEKLYITYSLDWSEILWGSERDGWNHLYLYDAATRRHRQVTRGEWVVRSVEHIDWNTRQVWVKAFGVVPEQDPYYAHLVCIRLDGSDLVVLTEGDGTHTCNWSPSRRWLIDTWSRVDQLPVTALRDGETGHLILELEGDRTPELVRSGFRLPERFIMIGRDRETPIYGIIVSPQHLISPRLDIPSILLTMALLPSPSMAWE